LAAQLLEDTQQLRLAAGRRYGQGIDVFGDIERRRVHPQRRAKSHVRHIEALTEAWDLVQSCLDRLLDDVEADATVRAQQRPALEDY
jgi:hypothetical protein